MRQQHNTTPLRWSLLSTILQKFDVFLFLKLLCTEYNRTFFTAVNSRKGLLEQKQDIQEEYTITTQDTIDKDLVVSWLWIDKR